MRKKTMLFLFSASAALLLTVLFSLSAGAETESITLTTYYPAPYGSYRQMDIHHSLNFGKSDVTDVSDFSQIPTPVDGMLVYEKNTIDNTRTFKYYDETVPAWKKLGGGLKCVTGSIWRQDDLIVNLTRIIKWTFPNLDEEYIVSDGNPTMDFPFEITLDWINTRYTTNITKFVGASLATIQHSSSTETRVVTITPDTITINLGKAVNGGGTLDYTLSISIFGEE